MRILVRFVGKPVAAQLVAEARERVSMYLQRPDFALTAVTCRFLASDDGAPGGLTECLVVTRGPMGSTTSKATRASAYAALGLAVHRAHRSLVQRTKTTKTRARLRRWRESQHPLVRPRVGA